ncbi:poly(R)-hydroxyalkanoic acid synthase subunit PhaE [[Eubacterium] cellulosolvens]
MAKKRNYNESNDSSTKESFEKVSNLWSDFSAQMEDKLKDLFESSASEYREIYKNWTDISEKMSKQMFDFTSGNENIYNNLYKSWKEYSERLSTDLGKVPKSDDKSYSELLDFWTNYSENFNEKLSDLMRDGLKEQYELYEIWMDTFARSATEGSKTGDIPSIINKYWLEAFSRFNDFFSLRGTRLKPEPPEPGELIFKQYDELYNYWLKTSTKMLDEVMRSPLYGNYLAQSIDTSMNSRQMLENMMTQNLKALGIPTKTELDEIRVELKNLSDQLDELNKNLEKITKKR